MADLEGAFLAFASYGIRDKVVNDMDGKSFSKLCKECKLIGGGLTATDVDLIFAKVKDKAARRISFDQFLRGLELMATKKGKPVEELEDLIVSSGGPVTRATTAQYVKFHDDKSTYTGVYARGGPTNVDKDKIADLSNLLDRTPADVRGVKSPIRGQWRSTSPSKAGVPHSPPLKGLAALRASLEARQLSPPLPAAPSPPKQRLKAPLPKFNKGKSVTPGAGTVDHFPPAPPGAPQEPQTPEPEQVSPRSNIDWAAISAKLPAGTDEDSKAQRADLFYQFDPNGNGYLSLAEVDKGIIEVLGLEGLFDAKPAIARAFHAAKASAATGSALGEDFVEKKEFRLLLSYLRIYFELYTMFDIIDTDNDKRVDRAEFGQAIDAIAAWGLKVEDVDAEFASIDENGGGFILFDELAQWAMRHGLDLPDDDE